MNVDFGDWKLHPEDMKDGYIIGNGKMYVVAGLGFKLSRNWKSTILEEAVSQTQLSWVVGPFYTCGCLGWGWDVLHKKDGKEQIWPHENIVFPKPDIPFWGVECSDDDIKVNILDIIQPKDAALLRKINVTGQKSQSNNITIHIPVYHDERNGSFIWWDGQPVEENDTIFYNSVKPEKLLQAFPEKGYILLTGASRRLYQDVCTPYRLDVPERVLVTTAVSSDPDTHIAIDKTGINIQINNLRYGEKRTFGVWLVTGISQAEAEAALKNYTDKDICEIDTLCRQEMRQPIVARTDDKEDGTLLNILRESQNLVVAGMSEHGGVHAQGYMYPMNYIRDQLGPFKLLLAMQEYEMYKKGLSYYIGMQNTYGIQNAYDALWYTPDPSDSAWDYNNNKLDSKWQKAEIPSYIIIFVRDYFKATNDLDFVVSVYKRLKYNIFCQEFNEFGLLSSQGDESYTQVVDIDQPDNFTDSNLLFIAAADFMIEIAGILGYTEDSNEFRVKRDNCWNALLKHLWDEKDCYFYLDKLDKRPATDVCLRLFYLNMGDYFGAYAKGNLNKILSDCINPIRIVPDNAINAGMDPGYLLYALSCSQHPKMHEAAGTLTRYATDSFMLCEYYIHEDGGIIRRNGGTQRPWESSVAGASIAEYILGLNLDLPKGKIFLRPHLPLGCSGWKSKPILLGYSEGEMYVYYRKEADCNKVVCTVERKNGQSHLELLLEFGGFNSSLAPVSKGLVYTNNQNDILSFATQIGSNDIIEVVFELDMQSINIEDVDF